MIKPSFTVPFRLRIVAWYGLLVLLTLFLFRLVSAEVIRRALYNDLDNSLQAEASWVRYLIRSSRARGVPDQNILEELTERNQITPRKTFIEIRNADGSGYYHSANLDFGDLSSVDVGELGDPETVSLASGLAVRRLTQVDTLYQVHVAFSLEDIDNATASVLASFFWLIPLALLLIVAGGFVLVTRFMRPIADLGAYADRLVSMPLHDDLPPLELTRKDELARLVATVTELVERMRTSLKQVLGFASLTSHELRTPLAIMRSQLEEALSESTAGEAHQHTLASTYDEVLRLSRISEDLLKLGTLHAGTFRLQPEEIPLSAFLEDFAEDARLLCEPPGIRFDFLHGPDCVCRFDAGRLKQVLFNLLDNAIRYTPRGGRIGLSAFVEGDRLVLEFSDTGSGIAPDVAERIFDPFYRRAQGGKAGGSGLGLALVKGIVEAHGGEVSVESEPGTGTTFRIWVPV